MDKKTVVIITLSLMLVVILGYWGYTYINSNIISYMKDRDTKQFTMGANAAFEYILNQSKTQGYVSLIDNNQTIALVLPQMCPAIMQQALNQTR